MIVQNEIHDPVIGTTYIPPGPTIPPQMPTAVHSVTVSGDHTDVPVGSEFRLYDDDDFGLLSDSLPRVDLANETMKKVFRPGFIEVVDAATYNSAKNHNPDQFLPFYRNYPIGPLNDGIFDDHIDLPGSKELWAVKVAAAYQGEAGQDNDPKEAESESEGATPGFGAQFSVVYVETVRDIQDEFLRLHDKQTYNNVIKENIALTAAHEMSHHPHYRTGNGHHDEHGLMGSEGYHDGVTFKAPSILRFRKTFEWTEF